MQQEYSQLYRSKEIQEIAGISKDKIVHLTRIGIIEPHTKEEGRGGRNKYSFKNLVEVMICKELSDYHVEPQTMKTLLLNLRFPKYYPLDDKGLDEQKYSFWDFWEMEQEMFRKTLEERPFLVFSKHPVRGVRNKGNGEEIVRKFYALQIDQTNTEGIHQHLSINNAAIIINLQAIFQKAEKA